jgi:hypothetical protein
LHDVATSFGNFTGWSFRWRPYVFISEVPFYVVGSYCSVCETEPPHVRWRKLDASGVHAQLDASGVHAQLEASGVHAQLDASGVHSQLDASGVHAQLDASGVHAQLDASGVHAQLDASGVPVFQTANTRCGIPAEMASATWRMCFLGRRRLV